MVADIAVRTVEAVDGAVLAALQRLVPQVSSSASVVDGSSLSRLVDGRQTIIFVAERDGDVVGTASLVIVETLSGRKGHVEDVAVDVSTRRGGIGTELMRAVITRADELGLSHVDLTSRPSREAANAFYRAFGFEERQTNVYRYQLTRRRKI